MNYNEKFILYIPSKSVIHHSTKYGKSISWNGDELSEIGRIVDLRTSYDLDYNLQIMILSSSTTECPLIIRSSPLS